MKDKNLQHSANAIQSALHFQYQISSQMLDIHLTGLTDDEYFWRPASTGLHFVNESGYLRADWPEFEGYEIGPASITWLTWHIIFWWSMVLDHSFGDGTLTRENIPCPGSAKEANDKILQLKKQWEAATDRLSNDEWHTDDRTKWPFSGKPFYELSAWLNLELMKNAAEIGYCRFLYASQPQLL
ncbi:DinB family protein [Paenibacillus sp. FSL R5-0527]|uniref:DinB family protein n=1 Tax=Paenibacillus TaxID=44249 RepID=UPI00097A86C3|nr:DinB family protein [Paenibacillus macerans]OMG50732.1 hypothetical protein BK140_05060 [Paenibacillus macerans]